MLIICLHLQIGLLGKSNEIPSLRQVYKMKLLILLLALSSVLCDNFTTIALSEANCILAVQYYNATSFNLLTCYQFKAEIESTALWGDCTKRCCDPNKTYEQAHSSIENCNQDHRNYLDAINQNQDDSSQPFIKKPQNILYIGLVGGCFIFILVEIIEDIRKRYRATEPAQQPIQLRVPAAPIFPSVPVFRIESESSLNPFRPDASIKWTKERIREEVCPICLLGDARVELAECEHMVHWECWKEWSKRKSQCALCRSNKVGQLKIFCFDCKAAYFTCRNQYLQRLTTCPKIVCQECK